VLATKKCRVLFVCIGNSCRSAMAESIARRDASDVIEPSSAGLFPLGYVAEPTQQTLLANGYPVESLSSKPLRRDAMEDADLIVNLSGQSLARQFYVVFDATGRAHLAPPIEDWRVADPYGEDPATYQRILEEIQSRVLLLAARLRAEHGSENP